MKILLKRFHLNCNAKEFYRLTLKLEVHAKKIVPCVVLVLVFSTAEYVLFESSHHRLKSTIRTFLRGPKANGSINVYI